MSQRIKYGNLQVSEELDSFLRDEVMPGIDIDSEYFWNSFEKILDEFSNRNKELLEKRTKIQKQIDDWHIEM